MKTALLILTISLATLINSFANPFTLDSTSTPVAIRTKDDTIRALNNFNKRIHRSIKIQMVIEAIGLTATVITLSTNNSSNQGLLAIAGGAFGGGLIANGILLKIFNKTNFKTIITDFQNGKKLPDQVLWRLKEKDFK